MLPKVKSSIYHISKASTVTLPYCVLERLFEATRSWRDEKLPESAGEPVMVWIDTLCCPCDQSGGKQLDYQE